MAGNKPPQRGHYGGRGIVLDITQEIINLAIPRDSGHCIVADALRAAVPDARFVAVDLQSIKFSDPTSRRRYIYLTPSTLQRLLVNYDLGILPEPFMIRLGQPAQIKRMDGRSEPRPRKYAKKAAPLPEGQRKELQPNGSGVVVLGGAVPPTAAYSNARGRRRAFGLRSLTP